MICLRYGPYRNRKVKLILVPGLSPSTYAVDFTDAKDYASVQFSKDYASVQFSKFSKMKLEISDRSW